MATTGPLNIVDNGDGTQTLAVNGRDGKLTLTLEVGPDGLVLSTSDGTPIEIAVNNNTTGMPHASDNSRTERRRGWPFGRRA